MQIPEPAVDGHETIVLDTAAGVVLELDLRGPRPPAVTPAPVAPRLAVGTDALAVARARTGAVRCLASIEDDRWIIDTWSTRWGTEQVITLRAGHDYDDDAPAGWVVATAAFPAASADERLVAATGGAAD